MRTKTTPAAISGPASPGHAKTRGKLSAGISDCAWWNLAAWWTSPIPCGHAFPCRREPPFASSPRCFRSSRKPTTSICSLDSQKPEDGTDSSFHRVSGAGAERNSANHANSMDGRLQHENAERCSPQAHNPLKKRLVNSPDKWPWSGFGFYYLNDSSVLNVDRLA